jgi:hypothetical protein
VAKPQTLVITQNAGWVAISANMGDGRQAPPMSLPIGGDGAVSVQKFYANVNNHGQGVASIDQADLVDTTTWQVEGDKLVRTMTFDVRHPYFKYPVGVTQMTAVFRRAG